MQWEQLGFSEDPFRTEPISESTLDLYTGHEKEIDSAKYTLHTNNLVMVVDGHRGVGTTSFANFVRLNEMKQKKYFTPFNEIKVEPSWNADTLLAAVVGSLIKSLEVRYLDVLKDDPVFLQTKSVVNQITEVYKSFGFSGFGFGASYGVSGNTTQPMIMPTPMIADHLESITNIITQKLNYKYGALIQLNNLDVGTVHSEKSLMQLLNVMRDYFQQRNCSWILVGDQNLRRFIAQKIDRLDDIIMNEIRIDPISIDELQLLIDKRIKRYAINKNVTMPVDRAVWEYLYNLTKGRLRYVFGLMNRLYEALKLGVLTDYITLEIAKPIIKELCEQRIRRHELTDRDLLVLTSIARETQLTVSDIATQLRQQRPNISHVCTKLYELGLIEVQIEGKYKHYSACLDAKIAYGGG